MTRCGRCKVRACLCAEIPNVVTRTRFVLVRHAAEAKKSSNTGRLAALALANSELHDYGRLGAPFDEASLAARDTWLLYPEGPPLAGPPPRPARLVVLDGTWQQARHMRQRILALRAMPILSLPPPAAPPRRLRRAPRVEGMSTLEAIARALALLEGEAPARLLDHLFALAVARMVPC